MRSVRVSVIAVALLLLTGACGGGDDAADSPGSAAGAATAGAMSAGAGAEMADDVEADDADGAGGDADAAGSFSVSVAEGAATDAERDGGDELTGITFADPTNAVCATVDRVGVVPESFELADIEAFSNASDEPVVFVYPEAVTGDVDGLPICSVADDEEDLADSVLHGEFMHAAHS